MGAARAARRAPRLGPLDRELLRQTLPAFATLVAEPLYVLADTAVVGRLGADELGGLALASTVLLSAHSLCIFLAYGTTAAVARLVGAGEERRAARQGVQGLWLAALLGAALALLGAVGGRSLVDALGGGGPAVAPGWLYLRISLLGVPAMLVGLAGVGYLRGRQDTRTPLLITAASASFNLVLEVVLIFGLGFGIGASAAATVAAQWGAAAVYAAQVLRRGRALGASAAPDWRAMRALGAVGAHLFVRSAALRGSFTLATAAAARAGRVDLAAHQIAFEVWSFLALALDAVGIAAQAIVGRLLGAGGREAARRAAHRALWWGGGAGVVGGALLAATSPWVSRIFSADEAVVSLTAFVLLWTAAHQPLNGLTFTLDAILIGAGDQRWLAWAMAAAAAAFAPALAVVWVKGLGIGWLWAALTVLMAARLALVAGRYRSGAWAVTGAVRRA